MKGGSDSNGGATGASRRSGATSISMECVMKFLAPDALAAAIIGKGGSVIADMRKNCNAQIALTDKGDIYPHTDCRVLTTQADSVESLNEVAKQIIAKISELGDGGAAPDGGELRVRAIVPRAAVGGIIGKEGKAIKEIRETSGAKISISEPAGSGPSADQLVAVSGLGQALEVVLAEVNKQIQGLNKEAWFPAWAASTGAVRAAVYTGAGGGGSNGLQQPRALNGASYGRSSPGVDYMIRVAQGLPPHVMEDPRGFALNCVVPNRLVGGLIGRGGSGTREVQGATGTKIGIREIPDDPDNQSLSITGPLANTCAAYMLMMKRYLDVEAQPSQVGGGQQPPR